MSPHRTRELAGIRVGTILVPALFVAVLAGGCRQNDASGPEPPPPQDPRIAAVERGLLATAAATTDRGYTLEERMRHYNVPGLSVAVIENFQLAWTKGYGIADRDAGEPVTASTLFQAGSISKPVAAAGAMVQVEAGRLELDQPINEVLQSWQLPDTSPAQPHGRHDRSRLPRPNDETDPGAVVLAAGSRLG